MYESDHLPRFGVASGLEFGIDQFIIDGNLELTTVRWHHGQFVDLELELLQ
jgi:hypothetical protein